LLTVQKIGKEGIYNTPFPWQYSGTIFYKTAKTLLYLSPLIFSLAAFLKTKKLYSTKSAENETNETKKCNNFKDLKTIGFKIFKKDTYARDKNEKYPLTICEILMRKTKLDKTETLNLDLTNKCNNKSPNIIYSDPSRVIQQKSEAAAMPTTPTTTTRKKPVDTEILIDRYLHKQRA
jgi:hypothetical protein